LRYFVAVAEELNFSRAAERLHIAQPPLSRQIQDLEHSIGAALFERGRKLALTPAGHAFLKEARATLAQSEWAVRSARLAASGATGVLRLGYMALGLYSPVLMDGLRAYRRKFPRVNITLMHLSPVLQLEALAARQIDAGILHANSAIGDVIRSHRILDDSMEFMLPAAHRLVGRPSLKLADLADEPFIMCSRSTSPPFYDRLMAAWDAQGFRPNIVCEADSYPTVATLVGAGTGVSFATRGSAAHLAADIAVRPAEDFCYITGVDVAWLAENPSLELRAFLGFCGCDTSVV
jgi:DNA-binding transcriptional LysR family regulator